MIKNLRINEEKLRDLSDKKLTRIMLEKPYYYSEYEIDEFENKIKENDDYSDTIFPEELAKVPRRFAIDKRNHWMIERSSVVVTYVKNNIGGAAKFKEIAEKKGLNIINISD